MELNTAPFWVTAGAGAFALFKEILPDLRAWFRDRNLAKKLITENIDSVLLVADELLSKIYDLAKNDFKGTYKDTLDTCTDPLERAYLLYLFSSFWGRLALLRQQANYGKLAKIRKGRRLLLFLKTFEARTKYRIIERGIQRIIGDGLLTINNSRNTVQTLFEFRNQLNMINSPLRTVMDVFDRFLSTTNNRDVRQKVLYFGILIKSFIDYFDPEHIVTSNRHASFINKLEPSAKEELNFRVFGVYLNFIAEPEKYYK
jgi:hypothetical protein